MTGVSECPTCGDGFGSEVGMKSHHTQVHGESLSWVDVECDYCGADTRVRHYHLEYNRNYCDMECKKKDQSEYQSGENNPYWKGGVSLTDEPCLNCGGDIEHNQLYDDPKYGRFCSIGCKGEWQRDNFTGDRNPRWEGGKVNYYGSNWKQARRQVLYRDQYRCRLCRKTAAEMDREPDVHHKTPIKSFDTPEDANTLDNLISLCQSCHHRWEGVSVFPEATP